MDSEAVEMSSPRKFYLGFRKGMRMFGQDLTEPLITVLLFVVYILGVGITSLFAKARGKHFLFWRMREAVSYWEDFAPKKPSKNSHYRQF